MKILHVSSICCFEPSNYDAFVNQSLDRVTNVNEASACISPVLMTPTTPMRQAIHIHSDYRTKVVIFISLPHNDQISIDYGQQSTPLDVDDNDGKYR